MRGDHRRDAVDRRLLDPLYEILDARGLEVYLVNARHTKNLPDARATCKRANGC